MGMDFALRLLGLTSGEDTSNLKKLVAIAESEPKGTLLRSRVATVYQARYVLLGWVFESGGQEKESIKSPSGS